MSLKIGSNQITPIQVVNIINNQSNKTVTPTKNQQIITVNDTIFEMSSYFRDGSSTEYKNFNGSGLTSSDTILITGWVGYERSGAVTQYWRNINIQTLYTTQTFNYDSSYYIKLDTSRQRLEIHSGEITCYQLNMYKLSGYDGMNQVTIEPIPSDYIIPTGTLTITNSGTVNASQYASVSIPGMANPTWTAATITSNAAKVVYSINLTSGFKNTSQSFSSSYTLPSVAGTTITPTTASQTAVAQYKWTTGSIIVGPVPNNILVYKKIIEKTVTVSEANEFFTSQTKVDIFAFQQCTSLSGVLNLGSVSIVGSSAFQSCSYITQVIGPNVTTLSSGAFSYCSRITSISFPNLTHVEYSPFTQCSQLSSVYLPNLISGRMSNWGSVQYFDLPKISYLSNYYFYNCYKLTSFNLPSVTSISGGMTFYNCSSLTSVYFPNLSFISGSRIFSSCIQLQVISLPKLQNITSSNIFSNCPKLTSIYLMSTAMVTLSYSNIFSGTSIPIVNSALTGAFGSIYVPNSLLNTYKTNSMWSWYSDRFVGV